ncbi:MAG: ferredoxin [Spirochaetes bacterium GWF1_51_8]|nr:MAG: ferredoxin [Spirochaetes bacterium GWF1_51_8]
MSVKIDQDTCIGCGICEGLYPDLFTMKDDGKAYVTDLTGYDTELAREAIDQCPVAAISED